MNLASLTLACAFAISFLAGLPAAKGATRVSSNTNCPSADAVSLKLVGLLSAGGPASASARVRAESNRDGLSLFIEVSTPGEETHQRVLPATGDCESRAEAAALIIAAWLDAIPAAALAAPGVPPRVQEPAPTGGDAEDFLEEEEPEPVPKGLRTLLGGALLGLVDGQGADTGLSFDGALLLGQLGLTVTTSLAWPRGVAVGQGTANYWRPTFELNAMAQLYHAKWSLYAQAGPALALLFVHGTGFRSNRSDYSYELSAGAGLRAMVPWNNKTAWLTVGGILWPQDRKVESTVAGSSTILSAPLPGWEVRLALGLSWRVL
jgi:hypothetical protein